MQRQIITSWALVVLLLSGHTAFAQQSKTQQVSLLGSVSAAC
jgi:hypothetical protein